MNYFNRNRVITIVLIALMAINITALVTIAAHSRIFRSRTDWRPSTETTKTKEPRRDFSQIFSERLGLTPDQEERMDELWKQNKIRLDTLRARMDTTKKELNVAFGNRELDVELINGLNDSITDIDREIRQTLFEFNLEVRGLLDEEQLGKYLEMHKEMRNRDGRSRFRSQMNMIRRF